MLLVGMWNGTTNLEYSLAGFFFSKLNVNLYDPMIPFLEIHPREMWLHVHSTVCKWMFIIGLFIIASNWKQSKSSSNGKQINKLWYIFSIEYYSALKMNELLTHATTWMKLKILMLCERCWTQKMTKQCMIPLIGNVQNWKIYSVREQINSCLGLGVQVGISKETLWDDGNILKLDCGDSCKTL